jgi:type II secretory pathway component GspD/PulD (secretin)
MRQKNKGSNICRFVFVMLMTLFMISPLSAVEERISLNFQETPLQEIMSMLSQQQRINILISEGISGNVSINLYDVTVDKAVRSIADAAGYAVEYRNGNYYIMNHDDIGKYNITGLTELRTFKIQYSDPSVIEGILTNYLSGYGKITNLAERKILVIEDRPSVLKRMDVLLKELDKEPKQIFIEAKILEVTLKDNESFGLDWKHLFSSSTDTGSFGTRGLSDPSSPGFFFSFVNPNVELVLNALKTRGRLRTLSTPKLLAMENHQAETLIGNNIGYQVTVTTNDVTTTSIEYLESGIILRVTPSVDRQGRILLDIHPEVSTGTVNDDGVPSKSTTQVNTQMLVPDGQTVFIGGLIKQTVDETREGIPILGDLPGIGKIFSNKSIISTDTETVVLVTPRIVSPDIANWQPQEIENTQYINNILDAELGKSESKTNELLDAQKQEVTQKQSIEVESNNHPLGEEYDHLIY